MKRTALTLALTLAMSIAATAAIAQTTPAPKAPAKASTTKPAVTTHTATGVGPKLPPGVPPGRGLVKTAFSLRYQDIKIGQGPLAEPNKLYHVHYTGWLASDGTKFDSSYDHVTPSVDKDGKPEPGEDGKPKMSAPEPVIFPQGFGRLIPGWDQGFEGMHIGGKRRLFIPYQLAYGAAGRPPKIPAKSDLIFDVELVDVTDLPANMPRPGQPRPNMPPSGGIHVTPGTPRAPATQPPQPGASPAAPPTVPAPAKPADPTNPTTTPAPVPPPPSTTAPTASPDKTANPAQPN